MQGNKSNYFFEQKLVTHIILMWTRSLDIFLCLQRKMQQHAYRSLWEPVWKDTVQFSCGSRRGTGRCLPLASPDLSRPQTVGRGALPVGFKFIVTKLLTTKCSAASSQTEVRPASPPEALATLLPTVPLPSGRYVLDTLSCVRDPVGGPGVFF